MSPVVKLGNDAKREQKRGRDKIVKRILTHRLNYRPLVAPSQRSLFGPSSCGHLAGEAAYLRF